MHYQQRSDQCFWWNLVIDTSPCYYDHFCVSNELKVQSSRYFNTSFIQPPHYFVQIFMAQQLSTVILLQSIAVNLTKCGNAIQ